jgi:hypothetical protein
MVGDRGVFDGGVSRARFLKLAGLGAGLSLFPGSLFSANAAGAQAVGRPEILTDARYPIAAWWPPPPVENTGTREAQQVSTNVLYADLAGAGFNVAIGGNGVGNERANRLALTACEDNDLRLVLADADLSNAIEGTATAAQGAQAEGQEEPEGVLQTLTEQDSRQDLQAQAAANRSTITQRLQEIYSGIEGRPGFGERPGLAGILLYDEPGRTQFADLRFAKQEVEKIFGPDELPYVNVWPSYANPKSAFEAESYTDYLERYMNQKRYPNSAVAPPMLSFDHYPLLADGRTTPDFFYNHAVIRNFAQRFGVPSWGFVQSMDFVGLGLEVRRPDEAEIFWQINVALAYGVKGIQYFTYWTPADTDVRFGTALIARTGEKTTLYDSAARANEFLSKVGRLLLPLPLRSSSVTHFGERRLPRGAKPFKGYPSYVKAASGDAAILGLFKESDASTEGYLLAVNRSPNKAARTRLTIPGTVVSIEKFDPSASERGEFKPATLVGNPPRVLPVTLGPGRAILYRLRTA